MCQNQTPLASLLALALLAACTQPTAPSPTAAPTRPAPTSIAVTPASPTEARATANGLELRAGNLRLSRLRPDRDQLQMEICFAVPSAELWFLAPAILSWSGGQAPQTWAEGSGEPAAAGQAACLTVSYLLPVQADLTRLQIEVPALRTSPSVEQICSQIVPEARRRLETSHPGVRVDCRLTELGYEAWVTHKPEAMPLAEAQQAFDAARAEAEADLFGVAGPWVLDLAGLLLTRLPEVRLLDPAPAPDLEFTLDQALYSGNTLSARVCFRPPDAAEWRLGETLLEHAGLESAPVQLAPALAPEGRRCEELAFEVPAGFTLEGALVKVYSITRPENPAPEGCAEYLPRLQAALDARGSGIRVACDVQSWGWQVVIADRPADMDPAVAERLVHNDELNSIYGFWRLPLAP